MKGMSSALVLGEGDGSCWAAEGGECVYVQVFLTLSVLTISMAL